MSIHSYIQFDWNDGNRTKCQKHGLTIEDIEALLRSDPLVAPDGKHSATERRFLAVGRTQSGRAAFVVFCWREGRIRPISARYMHDREARKYET